jgi:hypothetical protein
VSDLRHRIGVLVEAIAPAAAGQTVSDFVGNHVASNGIASRPQGQTHAALLPVALADTVLPSTSRTVTLRNFASLMSCDLTAAQVDTVPPRDAASRFNGPSTPSFQPIQHA